VRFAAATGFVVFVSGCSLLFPVSSLTSDTESPEDGGSGVDGGVDAITDRGTGGDVAQDAPSSTSPCIGQTHLFCDDFDRAGPPEQGWSGSEGSVALSTTRARSGTGSLQASLAARPGSATTPTFAQLKLDRPLTNNTLHVAFDVFVPNPGFSGGDNTVGLGCFSLRSANQRRTVCISVGGQSASFGTIAGAAIAFDDWVHVELDLGKTGMASGSLGASQRTAEPQVAADGAADGVFVGLGIYGFNQPTPALTAFYDNLVVDLK